MKINLKIHIKILILTFIGRTPSQCQSSIDSVKSELSKQLRKKLLDNSWRIENRSDEILLHFSETFFINASISPIYNRNGIYNKPDTITVRIKLEDNWSHGKVDSVKQKNKMIIEPLKHRFIAHYDSLEWKYVKLNPNMFLERPYDYLKNWQILNEIERQAIKKVIILPDNLIGNIGIFVHSDYEPGAGMEMEPSEINQRVFNAYKSFEEILGQGALFKADEKY
ncbi:MAG: hypothetical protein J7604_16480 [Sporocytophaga sp.]|uniref:hypothetical protein n=1 Tax=Sporocytophaga sp. TaxID=2231183 RepID=UPI001B11AE47|nr:hypothetical protein [Sporocytophaga sp.]MBO9701805.1 hypothetical protein [Sporocytophaga sp.]